MMVAATLLQTTRQQCGARIGDISHAIGSVLSEAGYPINVEFGGHGIGSAMHQDPHVPNTGRPGRGYKLRPGLLLAVVVSVAFAAFPVGVGPAGRVRERGEGGGKPDTGHPFPGFPWWGYFGWGTTPWSLVEPVVNDRPDSYHWPPGEPAKRHHPYGSEVRNEAPVKTDWTDACRALRNVVTAGCGPSEC
jgi:hypothetical protein